MIAKKIILNEVARKMTELTIFTVCVIVNQSEATIITEIVSKMPVARSFHEENPKEMTSFFDEGMSELTITYEHGFGSRRKTTNGSDEERNAMTNIRALAFVMSTTMNCKDLGVGRYPGDNLKEGTRDTGRPLAWIEIPGKSSLVNETGDGQTFHGKIFLRSRFYLNYFILLHAMILITSGQATLAYETGFVTNLTLS